MIRRAVAALGVSVVLAGFGSAGASDLEVTLPGAGVPVIVREAAAPEACRPGPWGELRATRIVTELPSNLAAVLTKLESSPWHFRDLTADGFAQLLRDHDVPEATAKALLESANIDLCGGIVVRPTDAALLKIPAPARAAIYKLLAADARNGIYADPFRYEAKRTDEWLEGSGLPPNIVAAVRQLKYQQGNTAIFADVSTVVRMMHDPADHVRLVKTLTRKPGLRVTLTVRPDSDVAALAAYYGAGHDRRAELGPVLEGLKRHPGGGSIDLARLLPVHPRTHLYAYPEPPSDNPDPDKLQDCHWSSFNFWNERSDDRLGNAEHVVNVLKSEYEPVAEGKYRFGDVLAFMRGGQGIHSCVYVADDVVYTKNGASVGSPWTLQRMSDVLPYYETVGAVEVVGYRKK